VSFSIATLCNKLFLEPIAKTQHRPIDINVNAAVVPKTVPFQRRFNFAKANWQGFLDELEDLIEDLEPSPINYKKFTELVHKAARNNIPRGCKTSCVPNLTNESARLCEEYQQLFEKDPFDGRTIEAGDSLLPAFSHQNQQSWHNLVGNLDMGKISRKAWNLIRKLGNDHTSSKQNTNVTGDQVADQLY